MTISATVRSHLVFTGLPLAIKEKLKASCSIGNPAFANALKFGGTPEEYIQIPPRIDLYEEYQGKIAVPRGLPMTPKTGLVGLKFPAKDDRAFCPVEFPSFSSKIQPYPDQKQISDLVYADATSVKPKSRWGNYLIVNSVSSGKTITGAMIAALLGQQTLVLVHTKEIFRAWMNDLPMLFDGKVDIGVMGGGHKTSRVGRHFTVCTLQKILHMDDEGRFELYQMFGTIIQDECHHAPCTSFYKVVTNFPAAYRIGLTGTKERADGLQSIMYRVFGRPFFEKKDEGVDTVSSMPINDVIIRKTLFELPEKRMKRFLVRGKWKDVEVDVDPTDHIFAQKAIAESPERDEYIIKDVLEQLRAGNNTCLIVTSRVEHAQRLAETISKRTGWMGAIMLGETSVEDRDGIIKRLYYREVRWLVATYQCIYEGASIRPFNRLFMAFSVADPSLLKQLFGRVRRKYPGKKDVFVFDYADMGVIPLRGQYIKRCAVYRDMKIKRFVNSFIG